MPAISPAVVTIETPALGDRSYLAHDGSLAAVIDPQRDVDRILSAAAELGVEIAVVAETHIHNDYVTGGLALAQATGAAYLVAAADEVGFDRKPVADGDQVAVGTIGLRVVSTPGHTPGHLAYLLEDGAGGVRAVFTGGSMLFGSVGRTDLIGDELTDRLARDQYRSVRRLAALLPDEAEVYPTHGFGSFCSVATTAVGSSTVGDQRLSNLALTIDDEETFVRRLLGGLVAHPSYYAHMGPINRRGPASIDLSLPAVADAAELRRRLDEGAWVIDLRQRRAFAASHVRGMISFELNDPLATYVGWTIPWGAPITLVGATVDDVLAARRQLTRIGIDTLAGHAVGGPADWSTDPPASYPVASFADLAVALGVAPAGGLGAGGGHPGSAGQRGSGSDRSSGGERSSGGQPTGSPPVVLDVRRRDEWAAGHIPGATNIPLGELPPRIDDLPAGHLWVHCAAGYRASVAASMIDRVGRPVTLVDDAWANAIALGLVTHD